MIVELTDALKQSALNLGQCLKAETRVQEYINLRERALQDSNIVELENKLNQTCEELTIREETGEVLRSFELEQYYALKHQVQRQPLVGLRDAKFEEVKAFLGQTAQQITSNLGIDYVTFAHKQEE
jgi:hypothetical protein